MAAGVDYGRVINTDRDDIDDHQADGYRTDG
jgi:hypothetical protein